jgi:hypothetical protein
MGELPNMGRDSDLEDEQERPEGLETGADEVDNAVAGDGDLLEDDTLLLADGYEDALIGTAWSQGQLVALYDARKCIEILMTRDGMSGEEAYEYFNFNTLQAYVGPSTPVFAHLESWGDDEQGYQDLLSHIKDSIDLHDKGVPQLLDGSGDSGGHHE